MHPKFNPPILKNRQSNSFVAVVVIFISFMAGLVYLNQKGRFLPIWFDVNITNIMADSGKNFFGQVQDDNERFNSESIQFAKLLEDGVPLRGPANAKKIQVRTTGTGSYKIQENELYFSTSDNSSPITNGRDYRVHYPFVFPLATAIFIYGSTYAVYLVIFILVLLTNLSQIKKYLLVGSKSFFHHVKKTTLSIIDKVKKTTHTFHDLLQKNRYLRLSVEIGVLVLLQAFVLWAYRLFLTDLQFGADDAAYYTQRSIDFLMQVRHGVYPLVGQTVHEYLGRSYFDAPLYFHILGLVDIISGRHLPYIQVANLTFVVVASVGALSAYYCLRRGFVEKPISAAILAALYISSPGVIALSQGFDLRFSFMTIPLLPWLVYNTLNLSDIKTAPKAMLGIAVSAAGLWWAHAPIALWSTTAAGLRVLLFLIAQRRDFLKVIIYITASSMVFLSLTAVVFAHWLTNIPSRVPSDTELEFASSMYLALKQAGISHFTSVPSQTTGLFTIKAGIPLLILLLLSLIQGSSIQNAKTRFALVMILYLTIFLLPIPYFTEKLWLYLPNIFSITIYPPMRLYPPLVCLIVFFISPLFAYYEKNPLRGNIYLWGWCLLFLLAFNFYETNKFPTFWRNSIRTPEQTGAMYRPEGIVTYFHGGIEGYVYFYDMQDPVMTPRVLALDDQEESVSNLSAVIANCQPILPIDNLKCRNLPCDIQLEPDQYQFEITELTPKPGDKYFLHLTFSGGIVQVDSQYDDYSIVNYVSELPSSNYLYIWDSREHLGKIRLGVTGASGLSTTISEMCIARYRDEELPIQIKSFFPYRVSVSLPVGGYLETSRVYLPGYTATVNGQPAEVGRSEDGMLMITLPAGSNEVTLEYKGTPIFRTALLLSAISWIVAFIIVLLGWYWRIGDGAVKGESLPPKGEE